MNSACPIGVLIAEPDPRLRRALRALIERVAHVTAITEATSAQEVLAAERSLDPCVIVVDVCLPSPEEGLALIRSLGAHSGRTIVAISLHSGLRSAALAAGASTFLDHGAPPEQLLDIISRSLPSA